MAVVYDTTIKNSRMTAARDAVVSGTLEIGTASMASVLAVFTLTSPGGTISGGVWTLAFSAGTVAAGNTGTAAAARIKDNGGTARITGLTVGTTGSDINLNNTSIASGQNVTLTSAAITHAA